MCVCVCVCVCVCKQDLALDNPHMLLCYRLKEPTKPTITIDRKSVKYVNLLSYLGNIVKTNPSLEDEIFSRVVKVNIDFGKLCHCLRNKRSIALGTKIAI